MTPEHKFILGTAALTSLPTIIFTGAVAYWSWRRDQERIIVQKSPTYWKTPDGTRNDATLAGAGIVVTNLSLFPVRIAGLGFRIDGKHALALDRDEHTDTWPLELASRARIVVYANDAEWEALEALGARTRIADWGFVAVASTETGKRFNSNRLSLKIVRPLRALRALRSQTRVG
jgi:hypothetical protein